MSNIFSGDFSEFRPTVNKTFSERAFLKSFVIPGVHWKIGELMNDRAL